MNSNKNNMVNLVDGVCKSLNVKKFLLTVFAGILIAAVAILIAGLLTKNILPREDQQFKLFLALLIIPVLFIIGLYFFHKNQEAKLPLHESTNSH